MTSLEEFAATRGLRLKQAARAITGDEHAAEDVVQDAFVKICSRWDRISQADRSE